MEDEIAVEGDIPSTGGMNRRYFEVECSDGMSKLSRLGGGVALEESQSNNNPKPLFNNFDFNF